MHLYMMLGYSTIRYLGASQELICWYMKHYVVLLYVCVHVLLFSLYLSSFFHIRVPMYGQRIW